MLGPLIQSLRPHQWIKNAFVAAPVIFAQKLADGEAAGRALLAAVLFSLLSGSVYLRNDLADLEKDRAHPLKRHRPIASGRLPVRAANLASIVLAAGALGAGFALDPKFAAVAACYFTVNLAYSRGLKNVALLDVGIIALGFLLRILAGGYAIHVAVSPWLALCTFLLALYMGMGKRLHELLTAGADGERQRSSLRAYRRRPLAVAMAGVALVTLAAYSAYTLEQHTAEMFRTNQLPWSIPFCAVGIARFFWLTTRRDRLVSPTEQIVRDPVFIANLGAWGLGILWIIYIHGHGVS